MTASPPSRRRSSPAPPCGSDHVGVNRPHSADIDLLSPRPADNGGGIRHNGVVQLAHHVIQRPTSGHVTTPNIESKVQDESSGSGVLVFDHRQTPAEFQQRHQQQAVQFFRAGQYITATRPPISSSSSPSSSYSVDSSTIQHHHPAPQQQQQQSSSYPLSYGYDMVVGDPRWMLTGQHPRTTFGPARPGADGTPAPYSGVAGGRLVGNAAPTPTRRATVEYRAQPTTTSGSVVPAGVYSMDYPPLNFAALPFPATAAYGKQNY